MENSVIDNTNLINMCRDCGAAGFVPVTSYVFDAEAATVTITDASTIPSGDTRLRVKYKIHDFFGNQVSGAIEAADSNDDVVDVSTLNRSKQLAVCVTVITTKGIVADGGAYGLMAAGNIAHWDVQRTAAV